jgi:hypothetical protein
MQSCILVRPLPCKLCRALGVQCTAFAALCVRESTGLRTRPACTESALRSAVLILQCTGQYHSNVSCFVSLQQNVA